MPGLEAAGTLEAVWEAVGFFEEAAAHLREAVVCSLRRAGVACLQMKEAFVFHWSREATECLNWEAVAEELEEESALASLE